MNGNCIARGYLCEVSSGTVSPFFLYAPSEINDFSEPFVMYKSFVNGNNTVFLTMSHFLDKLHQNLWIAVVSEVLTTNVRVPATFTSFDVTSEIWCVVTNGFFESLDDFLKANVGKVTCNSDKSALFVQTKKDGVLGIFTSNDLYLQLLENANNQSSLHALVNQYEIYLNRRRFCFVSNLDSLSYEAWYENLNSQSN